MQRHAETPHEKATTMSMLVQAADGGTTLVIPQVDPNRPDRVRAARYLNGRRIEDLDVPVASWPVSEAALIAADFYESNTFPEFRAEIDRATRQLFVAGGEPIALDDPADPSGSLVELADEWLEANRYARHTDWWTADQFSPITAAVTPEPEHDCDPHQRLVAGLDIDLAATRLRQTIRAATEQNERSARLQVVLYGDPTAAGFVRRLTEAMAGEWLSARIAAGLHELLRALLLVRNDGAGAAKVARGIASDFPCLVHHADTTRRAGRDGKEA